MQGSHILHGDNTARLLSSEDINGVRLQQKVCSCYIEPADCIFCPNGLQECWPCIFTLNYNVLSVTNSFTLAIKEVSCGNCESQSTLFISYIFY